MERTVYRYSFEQPPRLDPDPLYAQLRSAEPVARVQAPFGREAWLVTRYDAVKSVFDDPRFSRSLAAGSDAPRRCPAMTPPNGIISLDPPEHTRMRKLFASAFSMRGVKRVRPWAEKVVDGLVDELVGHGPPADIIPILTKRVPVMTICEVLGFPYSVSEEFGGAPQLMVSIGADQVPAARAARAGMLDRIRGLVVARRERPADDLFSALVREADNGGQITVAELVTMAELLLSNGYETTSNELANFVFALLTHPGQAAWLRTDLSRVPDAVEELLRFVPLAAGVPSAGGHSRVASVDVELDGVTIAAGDAVLPAINSANRDESVFAEPDRLALDRAPNAHLAFGHGPHHCLGAQLARMQGQVILTALLSRFPKLELAVAPAEVPWRTDGIQRHPTELLVTW
ncbi:MAG TPA: cytochrome P450 [Actinophytocola sp.]|uniref:cytochrome P450 n=1 Tax=Actinophytocola sp. TaxID=1872138 RepID=UPI002DBCADD5|nr:cytochrome P450 [Actinophytocola sp.]HEU5475948.1 cytochrome P450 [Actinophytocola sp.]